MAQTQLAKCDAVLQGDLINRVLTDNSTNSDSRRALRKILFKKNSDEAYEQYSQEVETAKKQGQGVSGAANYFGIGGALDVDINYANKLSRDEFKQKFNKAQEVYKSQVDSVDDSNSSTVSSYASFIRDSKSIDAWKDCIASDPQPGLYAYASRDDNNDAFINVVWSPGNFAATFPSIKIDISLPTGATVTETAREIAIGSGRTYRVIYANQKNGFQVTINGELRRADGGLVNNFSAYARVPRYQDPNQPEPPPVPPQAAPAAAPATPAPATAPLTIDGSWVPESDSEFDVSKLQIVTVAPGRLSVIVTFKHGNNAPIVKHTTAALVGGTFRTPTIVKQIFPQGNRDIHKVSIGAMINGDRTLVTQTVVEAGKPDVNLPTMFKRSTEVRRIRRIGRR